MDQGPVFKVYGSAADMYQLGLLIWNLLSGDCPSPKLNGLLDPYNWPGIARALQDEHGRYKNAVQSYRRLPGEYESMRKLVLILLSEDAKHRPTHAGMPAHFPAFELPAKEIYGATVEEAKVDVIPEDAECSTNQVNVANSLQ